ncbi:hypothetical protein [Herbidospora sp. RD11066]
MPAERLLIPDAKLPRPAAVAELVAGRQDDRIGDSRLSHFGANESLTRAWGRAEKGDFALLQEILTYQNPERAQAEFDAVPQGRQFNDTDYGDPVFEDISSLHLTAPSAAVSCIGTFPAGTCGRWVFRARYANHVTEFVLSEYIDGGTYVLVSRDVFLTMVRAVDAHIASVLG